MIQLVVSDIDGTLLQDGANAIPPAIFEQITRLRERGIRFCPASGRQYTSLRKLFAPVADQLYYLCENGAVVYGPGAPGPILSRTEMDWDLSLELCREILAHPRCEVLISGANTSYLCPKEGDIVSLIRDFVGNNVVLLPRCPPTAGTEPEGWSPSWPPAGAGISMPPWRGRSGWTSPWRTRGWG